MRSTGLYGSVFAGFWLALLLLLVFAGLHWLGIPAGRFLDWVIGTASFVWLVAIVTVPWNIYFEAKETQKENKIPILRWRGEAAPSQNWDFMVLTITNGRGGSAVCFEARRLYCDDKYFDYLVGDDDWLSDYFSIADRGRD